MSIFDFVVMAMSYRVSGALVIQGVSTFCKRSRKYKTLRLLPP